MKILILGSGGREHALAWKLGRSPSVEAIYCAPGNGGIASDAECLELDLNDVKAAADLAERLSADLTIVGPELPLVRGVADEFAARGLALLGPTQNCARLEGSKVFAKQFVQRHSLPTASVYGIFRSSIDAYTALCEVDWPLVIKADGLCGGKGVLVTASPDEATAFINLVMEKKAFGEAGNQVLLEEGLAGEELSYIILTDGNDFISMAATRDHKRAFDGDKGPNTGGMGAYSTDDMLPARLEDQILNSVVRPTLSGLANEGLDYRGFLYFGLMLTSEGPKVLEFNCRLGDPEAQALVMRADFDFAEACLAATKGTLARIRPRWRPAASICVVVASAGYPGAPVTGKEIRGLDKVASLGTVKVFHAGTRKSGENYYTSGGRVLGLSASAENLRTAKRAVYDAISCIDFEGSHFRRDVALEGFGVGRAVKETAG